MAPVTTFKLGLKMAVEASRGTAPAGSGFWQGGKWFDIITDGIPDITNRMATIFPAGHAGKRSINQQPPVQGRKWSDGNFTANMRGDYVVPLLWGALGGLSKNTVPSTTNGLLAAAAVGSPGSIVLTNQPSDGGAILLFTLQNLNGNNGTITVRGVDVYGNGASESITVLDAGSYFTRTSFSAIGASSITLSTNLSAASVSVGGYKYFVYTASAANDNPTFSIEKIGDPAAGAASKSFINNAMVVTEMGINTPADANDGLVSLNCGFEGEYGEVQNATTINDASMVQVIAAWTLAVTRDGANWHKVTNQSFTINSGNRNYRTAAGIQDPQGSLFGARELTGSHDLLFDNEQEYNIWQGASRMNLVLKWQTPWKLTSSDYVTITGSMANAYVDGEPSQGDNDGALQLTQDFRTVAGDTDVARFEIKTMVPPTAFGLIV